MTSTFSNEYGQPIGRPLPQWTPPPVPTREPMTGRCCTLLPLTSDAADDLHAAFALDDDAREWTYLPYGPFASLNLFREWVTTRTHANDVQLYTIATSESPRPVGLAGFLRIDPASGSIEVGHIRYSRLLQRTPAATEAMYLMMKRVFDLGYRRYEWKCDALNEPSRAAAARLGFSFEGIFRQATVYRARNRDTAWFSVIDADWPALATAFETWLEPSNFDANGRQKRRLSDLTRPLIEARTKHGA